MAQDKNKNQKQNGTAQANAQVGGNTPPPATTAPDDSVGLAERVRAVVTMPRYVHPSAQRLEGWTTLRATQTITLDVRENGQIRISRGPSSPEAADWSGPPIPAELRAPADMRTADGGVAYTIPLDTPPEALASAMMTALGLSVDSPAARLEREARELEAARKSATKHFDREFRRLLAMAVQPAGALTARVNWVDCRVGAITAQTAIANGFVPSADLLSVAEKTIGKAPKPIAEAIAEAFAMFADAADAKAEASPADATADADTADVNA